MRTRSILYLLLRIVLLAGISYGIHYWITTLESLLQEVAGDDVIPGDMEIEYDFPQSPHLDDEERGIHTCGACAMALRRLSPKYGGMLGNMLPEAERWNVILGICEAELKEHPQCRKATRPTLCSANVSVAPSLEDHPNLFFEYPNREPYDWHVQIYPPQSAWAKLKWVVSAWFGCAFTTTHCLGQGYDCYEDPQKVFHTYGLTGIDMAACLVMVLLDACLHGGSERIRRAFDNCPCEGSERPSNRSLFDVRMILSVGWVIAQWSVNVIVLFASKTLNWVGWICAFSWFIGSIFFVFVLVGDVLPHKLSVRVHVFMARWLVLPIVGTSWSVAGAVLFYRHGMDEIWVWQEFAAHIVPAAILTWYAVESMRLSVAHHYWVYSPNVCVRYFQYVSNVFLLFVYRSVYDPVAVYQTQRWALSENHFSGCCPLMSFCAMLFTLMMWQLHVMFLRRHKAGEVRRRAAEAKTAGDANGTGKEDDKNKTTTSGSNGASDSGYDSDDEEETPKAARAKKVD